MRVALLSCNAQARNAIGNQVAEKVTFFQERGAEVRVFLHDASRLHPELHACAETVLRVAPTGHVWDFLVQADLVIADYAQWHELLHFLPLLAGKKPRLILDYHGVTPAQHWEGPQRELLLYSARERGVVWCCDLAIAHTEFAKEELQRTTGLPADRIVVQCYPTDLTLFRPGEGAPNRKRLGLGLGPVWLYVGRLAASKRVPIMIEALARFPDAQAVIVGDSSDVYGEEARRCRTLAERIGVAKRVRFLGQVDARELAELYRSADALVMPSLHEGYCLPAIEAMACGLPVVAARTSALPETLGDAGLTFCPDDVDDLARQLATATGRAGNEALPTRTPTLDAERPRRIAVVAFRFGGDIIGGAETSLRTIAAALRQGGHEVEVFTTCTRHESAWTNELPAGTMVSDGLTVHRFPIDPHDRAQHHETVRKIIEADGRVDAATTQEYLRHSIHSSALMAALGRRQADFDAIITGPYLFGLTHDVAAAFPQQTLLLPCFHDEPFVRLDCWLATYGGVGGMLYHSPEEQDFGQRVLGMNHPNAVEIGTVIAITPASASSHVPDRAERRSIVYCGRFSRQKNVPLLLEFAARYEGARPGRFRWLFLGEGETTIPQAAWAEHRGRTAEEEKRRLLRDAVALVQLSTQESLSIVALEAWAQATPVIVHHDCRVLRGQVARADGGRAIADYEAFAAALDDLWERPEAWQALGANGRSYVTQHYGVEATYRAKLVEAVARLRIPLRALMRQRGLARAAERDRPRWRDRFGQFIEHALDLEPSPRCWDVAIQPQTSALRAAVGARSILIPVRVVNRGTVPALASGPAATRLVAFLVDPVTGQRVAAPSASTLPSSIVPGQSAAAAMVVSLPTRSGDYQVILKAVANHLLESSSREIIVPLQVGDRQAPAGSPAPGAFLETISSALAEACRLQRLPDDYVDVTQGRCARWKRWLKQKFLGNFKKAYVDVLSRQQSQVNQHLLTAVQQLTEYCATLEHAMQGLHQRHEEPGDRRDDRPEGSQVAAEPTMAGMIPEATLTADHRRPARS